MQWSTRFEWDGVIGTVNVECIPNDDPAGYGTFASDGHGFPVCTATVEFPRRVVPITGFGWGFVVHDDGVVLDEIKPLSAANWETVVPVLRANYPSPSWTFADTL